MNGSRGPISAALTQPPFVAAAALLLAAVVVRGPIASRFNLVQQKAAVPLRRPLSDLDKDGLREYSFARAVPMDEAVVAALGTEAYIDWQFVDASIKRNRDPRRYVRCFISYYTGSPSLVPHIPDNCLLGSGYQISAAENLSWAIPVGGSEPLEVPTRAVTFVKTGVFDKAEPTVIYTFHCNGKFTNTRNGVRARIADPFAKGAYFCKVEISFGGGNSIPATPTREQSIQATKKFLTRLLPVLLRDHLPDWQAFQNRKADAA
ncbi:MAG: exosortase-associated EpsI family protein [Phycisphaerae bacterium]